MRILIQPSREKTLIPVNKVLEIVSTDLNTSEELYIINQNETPIIKFSDTNEVFLIDNLLNKLQRINSEIELKITLEDLILLGDSNNEGDPRPYKVYTALLTQLDTDAPTALVLEDTLGAVEWSYNNIGQYKLSFSDLVLNQDKTFILKDFSYDEYGRSIFVYRVNDTSLVVETKDFEGTISNNVLNKFAIEVRVYN